MFLILDLLMYICYFISFSKTPLYVEMLKLFHVWTTLGSQIKVPTFTNHKAIKELTPWVSRL